MEQPPSSRRTWIRLSWLLIPAVLFVGVLTIAAARVSGPPEPGDAAPSFSGETLMDGGSLALSDLRGKPVVVNFWASWCAPCEDEAPMLKDAYEEYGDEIAFVGINIKDARSEAIEFAERYDLDFQHVRDEDGKIFDDYGLTGQP